MFTNMIQRLNDLKSRLLHLINSEPLEVLLELMIIWLVVYVVFRFLRGTRGARAIKGMLVLTSIATIVIKILASDESFRRLDFLYRNFLTLASLALVIVFQPELRKAFVRLGEAKWLDMGLTDSLRRSRVIEEVLGAVAYLSKHKVGALIALERQVGLRHVNDVGTKVDAVVTRELLNTIFWPGSALHDMGVVIQGDRLVAASVQFPLAEGEMFLENSELGSRHRAAVGLSQDTDALIVVVSEETGTISVAERGELKRGLSVDQLRTLLVRGLGDVEIQNTEEDEIDETSKYSASRVTKVPSISSSRPGNRSSTRILPPK